MAVLFLSDIWLHDAWDFSDHVRLRIKGDMPAPELEEPGRIDTYASGRRRSIREAGRFRTIPFSFYLDEGADELSWLRAHARRDVMYRDFRGELLFAVYPRVREQPAASRMVLVTLELEEVTGTVEV